MKKWLILSVVMCVAIAVQAQEKIVTIEAGTLKETLGETTFTSLVVKGSIDARDFDWLGNHARSVVSINLSECRVEAFNSRNEEYLGLQSHFVADEIPSAAFFGLDSLQSVVLPATVTSIGDGAFAGCKALRSVTGGSGVTSIGEYAFSGCNALETVTFPVGLKTIGDYAFDKCEALEAVDMTASTQLASIGKRAFALNTSLVSVKLPSTTLAIGEAAFAACSALKELSIAGAINQMGTAVFLGCEVLERVDLSKTNITTLPAWTFANCVSLVEVVFPTALQTIEEAAFYYCTALPTIKLPSGIKQLEAFVFAGCGALGEISFIPNSVETIERYAFYQNKEAKSVTLPSKITYIGDYAFDGCDKADNFYAYPEVPAQLGELVFANMKVEEKNLNVYSENSLSLYKSAAQWKEFGEIINVNAPSATDEIATCNDVKAYFELYNLVVSSTQEIVAVRLYDTAGVLLAHGAPHLCEVVVDTNPFASNIYVLQVTLADGKQVATTIARIIR